MKRDSNCGTANQKPEFLNRRHFLGILGGGPIFLQRQLSGHGMMLPVRFLPNARPTREESAGRIVKSSSESIVPRGRSRAADFYQPPKLSLMVGFIKDPQHKEYTLEQWAKNVGKDFDVHNLIARAKSAGMVDIIWYDKWIDGLVFHKTKTTRFMTSRDFLADLAPACREAGLKLIIYFNIFYDGNPEFAQWSCRDQRGQPIVFSNFWPCNQLSMYSPFRKKALQQVHELIADYDVDGLWLDVPSFPVVSYDPWTRRAFEKQYGKSMRVALPGDRRKFATDSIIRWTQEVAAYARKFKPSAVVTYNGADEPTGSGPRLAVGMAEAVDYFSKELHTEKSQKEYVPLLREYSKPVEAGYLVSDTWFSPMKDQLVRTSKSADEMFHVLSTFSGNALNLYLAIAPAHDGKLDEGTMQLLDLAGKWLHERRSVLVNSRGFSDVAIVLGTADPKDLTWPGGEDSCDADLARLETNLSRAGHLPCSLMNCAHQQTWTEIPAGVRTVVVPDRVNLTADEREKVLEFVKKGGVLVAFGRGAGLGRSQESQEVNPVFGVQNGGYLQPVQTRIFTFSWNGRTFALGPPVIYAYPESAKAILWAHSRTEGDFPLITTNSVGQGSAYFCAAPESAFFELDTILGELWEKFLGEPVWKIKGAAGQPTVTIREQNGRKVVNLIGDTNAREGPMHRYQSEYTRLLINSRLVPFQTATTVPENRKLAITSEGIWKSVEVYPNPSVLLLLE